jgi:hypothetical protein
LIFATHHLTAQIDWGKAMFVGETSVWLCNEHRWLWPKRDDDREDARYQKTKIRKKEMMSAGIAKRWRMPIVTVEGAIDAFIDCDNCIDATRLIPGMIAACGNDWFLVQDGATCHTSKETMAYFCEYTTVLPNWPSGSPDLNPIENLWSIVKRRVKEQRPDFLGQVIALVFQVWESLEQSLIDSLFDSMPSSLRAIVSPMGYIYRTYESRQ